MICQIEDISDLKASEAELTDRALRDPLTRLPNRGLVLDHLALALARNVREKTSVGVLFLDLDDFKNVTDSPGHAAGDVLLIELADRLRRCLRDTDTAARIGGDEFVVICGDLVAV